MHRCGPFSVVGIVSALVFAGCSGDESGARKAGGPPIPEPRPIPDDMCLPVAGGPYWALEGEPVLVRVLCSSGMSLAEAELDVSGLPEGAAWSSSSGEISWTPALDQAAVYEIAVTAAATQETVIAKIGIADAWSDPSNVPVVDPLRYTEEYGLPVFFLSPVPTTKEYTPASVVHGGHVDASDTGKPV